MNFQEFCRDVVGEEISDAWATFYKVIEGEPLTDEEAVLYCASTGRSEYVPRIGGYQEASGICGRRSEKTQTGVKFLLWKIAYAGYERQFRPSFFKRLGRHARLLRVPLILQDTRVARDVLRTAESLALGSPLLSKEVAESYRSELVFKNGIALTTFPATKASVRGLACPAGLLDEIAFVSIEGASDVELVRQMRPSMIQFGATRRLIKLSTPWQSAGVLFQEYSERLERDDLLVWQASTETMTPRIPREDLERERLADPVYFAREYLAQFTSDLEMFIPAVDVEAAVGGWRELAPAKGNYYVASLDASGLTGGDRFCFGIAHSEKAGTLVDLLRGWTREQVPQVCDEIAVLCRAYDILNITADQYSFSFLAELMRQRGIGLEQLSFTARSKAEIYFDLKTFLAQGAFRLPQHTEMVRELRALESVRLSGGSYRIGAPRGQHDDYVTVLALLANKVKRSVRQPWSEYLTVEQSPNVPQNASQPSPYRGTTGSAFENLDASGYGPERWWARL
jgi:hypothetical protein